MAKHYGRRLTRRLVPAVSAQTKHLNQLAASLYIKQDAAGPYCPWRP